MNSRNKKGTFVFSGPDDCTYMSTSRDFGISVDRERGPSREQTRLMKVNEVRRESIETKV